MTLSDKYELMRQLGHGGCGEVYLVRHKTLNLFRAVKVISKQSSNYQSTLDEARILKTLKHSGIPIIFDIEESEENYYIFEEYVDGITLSKFIDSYQPSLSEILDYSIQLCSILEYLHHNIGILHLDLKPDNIMLDESKKIWLIDYDNAIVYGEVMEHNRGSAGFAPPQQYFGNKPNHSWDIYSIGMLLLYMASGNVQSSIYHIKYQELIPIIIKCTHHSTIKRYRNVTFLKSALQQLQENKPKNIISKEIHVNGTGSGVGTTHFCRGLTAFLNKMGVPSLYLNSERQSLLAINNTGKDLSEYRVIIKDYGNSSFPLSDNNESEFCFVTIASVNKPIEMFKDKQVPKSQKHFIVWNLCSCEFFYNKTKHSSNPYCYRMPCVYYPEKGSPLSDSFYLELIADMWNGEFLHSYYYRKKGGLLRRLKRLVKIFS